MPSSPKCVARPRAHRVRGRFESVHHKRRLKSQNTNDRRKRGIPAPARTFVSTTRSIDEGIAAMHSAKRKEWRRRCCAAKSAVTLATCTNALQIGINVSLASICRRRAVRGGRGRGQSTSGRSAVFVSVADGQTRAQRTSEHRSMDDGCEENTHTLSIFNTRRAPIILNNKNIFQLT